MWSVYLAGEIHSDWRERIEAGTREAGLPVVFTAPVTDHPASDAAGTGTLGEESEAFWRDHKGAGVNAIRTQTLIRDADLVVVRFGDRYRQWNAALRRRLRRRDRQAGRHPARRGARPRAEGGRPRRRGDRARARAGGRRAALRDPRRAALTRR